MQMDQPSPMPSGHDERLFVAAQPAGVISASGVRQVMLNVNDSGALRKRMSLHMNRRLAQVSAKVFSVSIERL
jgi:hypothetical protein